MRIVCSDEAQKRFTVVPGTVAGRPASSAARRPRFMPCFSCGNPQPTITSTISSRGSSGTCSSADLIANAARSSGRASTSEPFAARPIGVRVVETMTASGTRPSCRNEEGRRSGRPSPESAAPANQAPRPLISLPSGLNVLFWYWTSVTCEIGN